MRQECIEKQHADRRSLCPLLPAVIAGEFSLLYCVVLFCLLIWYAAALLNRTPLQKKCLIPVGLAWLNEG